MMINGIASVVAMSSVSKKKLLVTACCASWSMFANTLPAASKDIPSATSSCAHRTRLPNRYSKPPCMSLVNTIVSMRNPVSANSGFVKRSCPRSATTDAIQSAIPTPQYAAFGSFVFCPISTTVMQIMKKRSSASMSCAVEPLYDGQIMVKNLPIGSHKLLPGMYACALRIPSVSVRNILVSSVVGAFTVVLCFFGCLAYLKVPCE